MPTPAPAQPPGPPAAAGTGRDRSPGGLSPRRSAGAAAEPPLSPTALARENAALRGALQQFERSKFRKMQTAHAALTEEVERLRAENAELRQLSARQLQVMEQDCRELQHGVREEARLGRRAEELARELEETRLELRRTRRERDQALSELRAAGLPRPRAPRGRSLSSRSPPQTRRRTPSRDSAPGGRYGARRSASDGSAGRPGGRGVLTPRTGGRSSASPQGRPGRGDARYAPAEAYPRSRRPLASPTSDGRGQWGSRAATRSVSRSPSGRLGYGSGRRSPQGPPPRRHASPAAAGWPRSPRRGRRHAWSDTSSGGGARRSSSCGSVGSWGARRGRSSAAALPPRHGGGRVWR
eukprot:TRINITY_DN21514_c0_g1_i1.p1 TRINITY_DN21514_c0_g1~~TRINITY_DN21514_c0_g1_i1.p1  ORF type:complete len:354 (+),score=49.61 TRINITY_DN21514_c0_g1_i1:94-1155(+)